MWPLIDAYKSRELTAITTDGKLRFDEDLSKRISVDPNVMVGKPVVHGTRIPVEIVLDRLAYDLDVDAIPSDYPTLTRDDIRACVDYAVSRLAHNRS